MVALSPFLRSFIYLSLTISMSLSVGASRSSKGLSLITDSTPSLSQFPAEFIWGTSTSAFQVEGAWNVSGRGVSIWDTWSLTPGNILDGSTAEVADDHYHRYLEDIELLANTGFNAYRLSISWSRVLPAGEGEVSQAGVDFYNRIIDAVVAKGIEPFITLHHFDLPQALDDKYTGWLNDTMVGIFRDFADLCFAKFGDRVKKWITLNEPGAQAGGGWGSDGHFPPGRCSNRSLCQFGNSGVEPYLVVHNMLRAHAATVELYNTKYRAEQGGSIGIAEIALWYEAASRSQADAAAAERCSVFQQGWVLDPIFKGDYPEVMRKILGDRLPTFTKDEIQRLNNSLDFIGLNHYLIEWVSDAPFLPPLEETTPAYDRLATTSSSAPTEIPNSENLVAFSPAGSFGFLKVIEWTSSRYPGVDIYITENGYEDQTVPSSKEEALSDNPRIKYYTSYLKNLVKAIRNGANVKGYFAWAFMDNFEWNFGYNSRYGLYYVDRATLNRYPKDSALWFSKLLTGNKVNR